MAIRIETILPPRRLVLRVRPKDFNLTRGIEMEFAGVVSVLLEISCVRVFDDHVVVVISQDPFSFYWVVTL